MPRKVALEPVVRAAALGIPSQEIATGLGVNPSTVSRLLAANSPLLEQYKTLNEPGLKAVWGMFLDDAAQDYKSAREAGTLTWRDRQSAAITLGIASDKLLLAHGRPSAISANIHEVRVSLGEVAGKLLRIAAEIRPEHG